MPQPNIGYLFNKDYYTDKYFTEENNKEQLVRELEEKNKAILNRKLSEYKDLKENNPRMGAYKLYLKTTYPGLLIGGGYMHEVGQFTVQENKETKYDPANTIFKIGFYFDYTSGLPVIPASSVKGVLRSAFEHKEYIGELLKQLNINVNSPKKIDELREAIFEGEVKGEKLSIYKRDVFYDAEIDFEAKSGDLNKNFLGDDYITPHYPDLLKNPIPIKFLKVLPGVIWRFSFDLQDSCIQGGCLQAEQKLRLFRQILCDLGVGARTNLGYGCFDADFGSKRMEEDIKQIKEKKEKDELEGKSELGKRLYFLSKEPWSSVLEKELVDLCRELTGMEINDRQLAAVFIKDVWMKNGKWQGKLSIKQSNKVQRVKQVLSELTDQISVKDNLKKK